MSEGATDLAYLESVLDFFRICYIKSGRFPSDEVMLWLNENESLYIENIDDFWNVFTKNYTPSEVDLEFFKILKDVVDKLFFW